MTTIRDLLASDHHQCDDYFVTTEQAVADGAWDKADSVFAGFRTAMLRHFAVEESVLFPAFEERTGMRMGPTQVMRTEHAQMRELLEAAEAALTARSADDYSGYAETLLIMMQQHNMKEENILYPMCDQHLVAELPTVLERLNSELMNA